MRFDGATSFREVEKKTMNGEERVTIEEAYGLSEESHAFVVSLNSNYTEN